MRPLSYTIVILFMLSIISGCTDDDKSVETIILSQDNIILHEDYYYLSDKFMINDPFQFLITIKAHEWPQDYKIEVIVLKDDEYDDFIAGRSVQILWYEDFLTEGPHEWETEEFDGNDGYYVIVDNSDSWVEDTDWDGNDDILIFDIEIVLKSN